MTRNAQLPRLNRRTRSIFQTLMLTVGALVVIEIALLSLFLFGTGINRQLNKNACDILSEKVLSRRNYLENEMLVRWSNLSRMVDALNQQIAALLEDGSLTLADMEANSPRCAALLRDVSPELVELLRSNSVSDVFLFLNPHGGDTAEVPGLYLRDLDPASRPSAGNADLLLLRAPLSVVQDLNISTHVSWQPAFQPEDRQPFAPILTTYPDISAQDTGRWISGYQLQGDTAATLSFALPLALPDGTRYGVLGVCILPEYLSQFLPSEELSDDPQSAYALLSSSAGDDPYYQVAAVSGVSQYLTGNALLEPVGNKIFRIQMEAEEPTLLCAVKPLKLYDANTPFEGETWLVAGVVPADTLFAFSQSVRTSLWGIVALLAAVGVLGCLLVSVSISRPLTALAGAAKQADPLEALQFQRTHIAEVDQLLSSMEALSRDIMSSSSRLSTIMEMASVKIAGFELDFQEQILFVTNRFFEILGRPDLSQADVDAAAFIRLMNGLDIYETKNRVNPTQRLYRIPKGKEFLFISLNYQVTGSLCIGLIEDVTASMLDLERLEHERDHDVLTMLKNRRAFQRIADGLFSDGREKLKTAALLMIDLDHLKFLNDTYGHDCGDRYINGAAACFRENVPPQTLVARISGDEFYFLFYGYDSRQEITVLLDKLESAIHTCRIELPDGQRRCHLQASGGVAWYPQDAQTLTELVRQADFAMYCVKRSGKGRFGNFNAAAYRQERNLLKNRADLEELLEKQRLYHSFQPIVDARTGAIFAYEALMRSDIPSLATPDKILAVARMESRLNRIEELTWFKSLACYEQQRALGNIGPDCRIFINSLPSQSLRKESLENFERRYAAHLSKIVLEVTENEPQVELILRNKLERILQKWGGAVALDDYGSGYNSEKTLLRLNPMFIKVDLSIIRDIHVDPNKQKVVENIVSYAHERNMFIIAEGIEQEAEMEQVVRLGVDYLQGFFLARPQREPAPLPETVVSTLRRWSQTMDE